MSGDTLTTVPDTVMALYTSTGGCGGTYSPVACNDDSGGLKSSLSTTLNGGVTYYILIWVSASSAPLTNGHGAVQLKVSKPVIPSNDTCAGAEVVPGSGPFPYLSTLTDNTLATNAGDPPAPLCHAAYSRSVWYRFTPVTTTTYTLSTCNDTATTDYDSLMAVYASAGGCAGPFTAIACNDNSCGFRAAITTTLTAGVTYYIVVWETENYTYTPGETSIQLRVSGIFPPTVTVLPANDITSSSAVLNATVNAGGAVTTAWFDWGLTTNFANLTSLQTVLSTAANQPMSALVSGLTAGKTYFFRVRATNVLGSSSSSNASFVWATNRPYLGSPVALGGGLSLTITGMVRQRYSVYGSTNLNAWSLLGSAIELGNGQFTFIDSNYLSRPVRFYRAVAP